MQQKEKKVPSTKKGWGFKQKHKNTQAMYHQELADYIEFESLPFIRDPLQRGTLKYQIARNRDQVIKLKGETAQ